MNVKIRKFLIFAMFLIFSHNKVFASFLNEMGFTAKKNLDGGFAYRLISNYRTLQCYILTDDKASYVKDVNDNLIQCDCVADPSNINAFMPLNPDKTCGENLIYHQSLNKKYKVPIPIYKYSDKYDGCYFGDNVYPKGKEYLALFDTLDCKLATYMRYTPLNDPLPGIIMVTISAIFFSPVAILFVIASVAIFFFLVALTVNILYIFLTSMFSINLLVFISPLIFPTMLFEKYKNAFTSWFKQMYGYILQFIFMIIFASIFILVIDKFGVGDGVKFVGHGEGGRLPSIMCSEHTSLLCIFNFDKNSGTKFPLGKTLGTLLGIGPLVNVIEALTTDFTKTINTLITFAVLIWCLQQLMYKLPGIVNAIIEGGGEVSGKSLDFKSDVRNRVKSGVQIAGKVGFYGAKSTKDRLQKARTSFQSWKASNKYGTQREKDTDRSANTGLDNENDRNEPKKEKPTKTD